jgi:hypothetical protein
MVTTVWRSVLLSNTEVMQLHATSDHYDFDFHAFSLSGFDVTVNRLGWRNI